MDEGEALKTGVAATIEATMKPFVELLQKLAGPAAEEMGFTLKDHVQFFRLKRQVRLLQKTRQFIEETGRDAHQVPLKILLPIFDQATLEEDDELQDRWAALLANAATSAGVIVGYGEVLKQLIRDDVLLLRKQFYEQYPEADRTVDPRRSKELVDIWVEETKKPGEDFTARNRRKLRSMNRLARLGLCNPLNYDVGSCHLTQFGYDFVETCESKEDLRRKVN